MTDAAAQGLNTVASNWCDVPRKVLVKIFSHLETHQDLYHAGLACTTWYEASGEDSLWENLMKRKWRIGEHVTIRPRAASWRYEYKRLLYYSPSVLFATLNEHILSVEHVSSSNSGKYFATCSKDCTVKVWEIENPFRLKSSMFDLTREWMFTKFNEDDTMLLAACFDDLTGNGETVIFDVTNDEMRELRNVRYHPCSMYCDWYDGDSFIHADFQKIQSITYYKCMVGLISPQIPDSIRLCKLSAIDFDTVSFIRIGNIPRMATFTKCLLFVSRSKKYNDKVHFKSMDNDEMQLQEPSEDATDMPEHSLALNGQISGLALNKEHTLLYINTLEFVPGSDIAPAENKVFHCFTIHVVDMQSKTITHKFSPGHKSTLPGSLIYLDVSRLYLASGSEDDAAYLCDLHYGVQVARLEREKEGVASVAFSRINQEVLISVSDDQTIKIWTSRNYLDHPREFQIKESLSLS